MTQNTGDKMLSSILNSGTVSTDADADSKQSKRDKCVDKTGARWLTNVSTFPSGIVTLSSDTRKLESRLHRLSPAC